MPLPELTDEVSEVHTVCPFCAGEYVISRGGVRHSVPACFVFEHNEPAAYIGRARLEEARQHVAKG